MNIEPLGGVSAYQAQAAGKPQKTEQADTPKTEIRDDASSSRSNTVDPTTVAVNNVAEKDQGAATQDQENLRQQQQMSSEAIKKAVEKMNLKMSNSIAEFGIHEGTNRITIKIVDKDTKEVIKELPPEKTLDMIAKAWELAGILVDETR